MRDTLISILSSAIEARRNCLTLVHSTRNPGEMEPRNTEWAAKWHQRIAQLVDMLPSGAGIDSGTKVDLDASHASKLVLYTSYHHMNEAGYYDGWTEHTIVVTPTFRGISLRISGRNRNEIKDYLYETYEYALTRPVEWDKERERYVVVNTVAA